MRTLLIDTIDTVIFLSSLLIQERKCGRLASEGPSDSNVLGNFSTQFSLSFLLQVSSRRAKRYLFSWSLLRLGFPTAQGFLNTFKGTYLIHFCQHLMSIRLDVILIFSCQKKNKNRTKLNRLLWYFKKEASMFMPRLSMTSSDDIGHNWEQTTRLRFPCQQLSAIFPKK